MAAGAKEITKFIMLAREVVRRLMRLEALRWTRKLGPEAKLELVRSVVMDGAEDEQDETED